MRIHTTAAFYVLIFAPCFALSSAEWAVLFLTITLVMALECVNTALERLCDKVSREFDKLIRTAKDAAAGAVLICAAGAVAVAVCLFWKPAVWLEILRWFGDNPAAVIGLIVSAVCAFLYCVYGIPKMNRKSEK